MTDREQAAAEAALMINEAERAMDIAMAAASRLVTQLPELQTRAGLNGSWAQPAVVGICAALGDLTSARGSLIEAHRSLSVVQRRLGVTVAEVPNNDKGPKTILSADSDETVATPRVVALRSA